MQRRHERALAELGLAEVRDPAPRIALAKQPMDLPPGQDPRLIVKFSDDMLARLASGGGSPASGREARQVLLPAADYPNRVFFRVRATEGI